MTSRTQRFLVVVGQIVPWIDQSWECAKEVLHERTTRKSTTTAEKKKIWRFVCWIAGKIQEKLYGLWLRNISMESLLRILGTECAGTWIGRKTYRYNVLTIFPHRKPRIGGGEDVSENRGIEQVAQLIEPDRQLVRCCVLDGFILGLSSWRSKRWKHHSKIVKNLTYLSSRCCLLI